MENEICNQCDNHCPVTALKCNHGRMAFNQTNANSDIVQKDDKHKKDHDEHHGVKFEGILGQLQECGHAIHHGAVDEDSLSVLTAEEQTQLGTLLSKLLAG